MKVTSNHISLIACSSLTALLLPFSASAQALKDSDLAQIRFEQKLNAQISLSLPFRDEAGKPVKLGDYFGQKPVILVLGYYECPMLCTAVLNGLVQGLEDLQWTVGRQFEVINVSIDPRETPALAAAKKRTYLQRYGRPGAAEGWHFLTGEKPAIQQLAYEVGFHYAYDAPSGQFAHPSGLVLLTPRGKIARYIFGVTYPSQQLQAGLQAAASNKISSPIRELLFLCFHYNPLTGKYSEPIMWILRSMAIATLLAMAVGFVRLLWRNPRKKYSAQARSQTATPPARTHLPEPDSTS